MSSDRILLQIAPQPRLARVVRAALLWEGRACGMTAAQAVPFARAVAARFVEVAGRSGAAAAGRLVRLSIERSSEGLRARLEMAGRGGRTWTLRRGAAGKGHSRRRKRPRESGS